MSLLTHKVWLGFHLILNVLVQALPSHLAAKARIKVCSVVACHMKLKPFKVHVDSVQKAKFGQDMNISIEMPEEANCQNISALLPSLQVS